MTAAAAHDHDIDRDTPMTGRYVRALILEAAVIVALWMFGRLFS